MTMSSLTFLASTKPAGGAALDQIIIANLMAGTASALLLWLVLGHRSGKRAHLARAAAYTERVSGMPGWASPRGGLLFPLCPFFSLLASRLDALCPRLFGQDVTLWGPTHLMLFGGAGLTLIGMAVLVVEGLRARPQGARPEVPWVVGARRVGTMGGLLIGLSTF